ncbi:class I SAM-dependent methyltransferase [Nakamurella aerolata]|uniref:Class I SAM-dependent methyltransferase n=1 Tax=Nakamurella aerolata TaxID=1656892 RepID=A0A849A6D2_9ACTN|nr:class I SAM-dependent methyltransferase [Nakamurella aerolata]NNG34983.1 class I SAM-dependent methyltransferase [Nakamurella aerolata]
MAASSRALSFGQRAATYAQFRPGYPDAAVQAGLSAVDATSAVGVGPDQDGPDPNAGADPNAGLGQDAGRHPWRVVDLAAGTGKLTRSLVGHGAGVIGVEPDPQMLAELRRTLPGVDARIGTAEHIPVDPVADGPVRLVAVGQAMHWFDMDTALPEIARVLAPGGVLAGFWNRNDSADEFTSGYQRLLDRWVRPPGGSTASGSADDGAPFRGRTEFTDPRLVRTHWSQRLSRADLHGLVDTLSYVIAAAPEQVRGLHAGLDDLAGTQPDPDALTLAQICDTWIARRRSAEEPATEEPATPTADAQAPGS